MLSRLGNISRQRSMTTPMKATSSAEQFIVENNAWGDKTNMHHPSNFVDVLQSKSSSNITAIAQHSCLRLQTNSYAETSSLPKSMM